MDRTGPFFLLFGTRKFGVQGSSSQSQGRWGEQNSWRSPWDCEGEEMSWEKPLRVHRRLSGPATSFSHLPLSSQMRCLLRARDWGLSRQAEPMVTSCPLSSECHCSLLVSFPLRAEPGGSQEEPSSGPLTRPPSAPPHAFRGHDGGLGTMEKGSVRCSAWLRGPTASPLVRVDARCGEETGRGAAVLLGSRGALSPPLPSPL